MERPVAVACLLAVSGIGIWQIGSASFLQDRWDRADQETRRLAPRSFPEFPVHLIRELQRRGCQIPQSFARADRHNVIRGEFAKKGQTDWAVLCSIERVSSILVFWNGSENNPAEIARDPDKNWLQTTTGEGNIGFSRIISAVGKKLILDHNPASGGQQPPPVDHDGVEDAFAEKASVVHYFYHQQWMKLTGAD